MHIGTCSDCKQQAVLTKDHLRILNFGRTKTELVCRNCHDLREFWRGKHEIKESNMKRCFSYRVCQKCKLTYLGIIVSKSRNTCSNCLYQKRYNTALALRKQKQNEAPKLDY